jgi:chaperonin GroES
MIKKGTKNSVLVEIEKLSEDEYQFEGGFKLYMPGYSAKQRGSQQIDVDTDKQRIFGTCVAIPDGLSKGDLVKFDSAEDMKFVDSIEPEVQVGDRVYFSYIALSKSNLVEFEGKSYCNINYSSILCVVRKERFWYNKNDVAVMDRFTGKISNEEFNNIYLDPNDRVDLVLDKIIPIGGNIICEEYYGKDAQSIEVDGKTIHAETSASGLITGIIKKPSQKHAVVKITGTPLKGDEIGVEPGDLVVFPDRFGFKNDIEGKEYLFLKYWDIISIMKDQKTDDMPFKKVVGPRVLVEPTEVASQTASGIIIPDIAKERPVKGKVIKVGEAKKGEEMSVKVGDEVLYGRFAGVEITEDGKPYIFMREDDIFAVI